MVPTSTPGQAHRAAIVHRCLRTSCLRDSPSVLLGVLLSAVRVMVLSKGVSPFSPPREKLFAESNPEMALGLFGQRSKAKTAFALNHPPSIFSA